MIISVFTPHGGCPERCSFCDQSVSGGTAISSKKITETIEAHLKSSKDKYIELAFYGGTFTAMPKERQLAYLNAAKPYLDKINSVRISTRTDALEKDWLLRLKEEYKLNIIELGAQSFNPRVLKALGRSHSVESISESTKFLKELGFKVSLHFMIGCPAENRDNDKILVKNLREVKPDFVRIHPLLVLKDTPIEEAFSNNSFKPLDLETAVERCATLTEEISSLGIDVIRLGLQPNELLSDAIVAGPFHPAFGDLVKGRRLRRLVSKEIELQNPKNQAKVTIEIDEKLCGSLKGPDRQNLKWLKEKFSLGSILVKTTRNQPKPSVRIH